MTDDVAKITAGLSETQRAATLVMESYDDTDTPCRNVKDLAAELGSDWSKDDARYVARELVQLGLAKCESGLTTSDGDFYGSGWCLTALGSAVRAYLEKDPSHD